MKKIYTLAVVLVMCLQTFAQAPAQMSYQAVVRNASNALVTTAPVGMRISILQGSAFGSAVYIETQVASTNANGLVSINIGTGTAVLGNFASINWANGPYFIKTETDPAGSTNYSISGTSQLLSVPYALFAQKTGYDGDSSSLNELQTLSQSGSNVTLSNGGGTISVNDADASPTNEIQTLSQSGNSVTLSNGGGTINVDDADASPTNEIQTLSQSGNTITLSNGGGSVTVSSGSSYWQPNGSNIYYTAGRVGIGKTSPAHALHVGGNTTFSSGTDYYGSLFDITGGSTNNYNYQGLRVNLTSGGDGVQRAIVGYMSGAGSSTNSTTGVFGYNVGSGFLTRGVQGTSTSTANGNQGVFGRSDGTGDNTNTSSNTGVFGYATGNTYGNIGLYGLSDYAGSANYGVYGSAANATTNYAGYFNGNVTVTGTFSNPSDQKLKKNISPMENALGKVMGLEVKTYEYNTSANSGLHLPAGKQFGFIAQELEKTYPELVANQKQMSLQPEGGKTEITEYKAINYIGLIPVLTKAIQEQQLLIEQLQQRISQLEKQK